MSGSILKVRGGVWNLILFGIIGPLWAGILIVINSFLIYYQFDGKIDVLKFGIKTGFLCIGIGICFMIFSPFLNKHLVKIKMLLKSKA